MKKFFKDESGQGMVEYGLIIALIAVVVIVALTTLGGKIDTVFKDTNTQLDTALTKGKTPNTQTDG